MLLRKSIDDYKYSALCCLLFIHGLYNNPNETKKEENYNNKASAKKWDKLIKESDDAYLIENINKQKNKNVVFGSASLFTSFSISNNNTIIIIKNFNC